eukprot:6201713-Pleurochrysis_carterae.AAC.1
MASGAVVGAVAAGLYSGINSFLDAAAFATLVFAPAALPLDVRDSRIRKKLHLGRAVTCSHLATWRSFWELGSLLPDGG